MVAQDFSPDHPVTCKETRYRKRKRTPSIEDFVARDKKDAYQGWSDDEYTEDFDEDSESASTSSKSSSDASNKQQDSEDYDSDTVGDKELAALGVKRAKTRRERRQQQAEAERERSLREQARVLTDVDLEAAFTALDSEDGAECQATSKESNQEQDDTNKAKGRYDARESVDDFLDIPVQAGLTPNTAPEPQRSSRPHANKRRCIDEDDDEVTTEADELRLALIKSEREIAEKEADADAKEEEDDEDSLFVQD